jgi:uncharacterized radical SAM superfamily Fe-S cluster-containing enzyme
MNIYWTASTKTDFIPIINFHEPENVIKSISDRYKDDKRINFLKCPAVLDTLKNVYALKFPVDYDLNFATNNISSNLYNQKFHDEYIYCRSLDSLLISINLKYYFFCEESLELEVKSAYFDDNDFSNKTMFIPGQFDIGKWIRPLECAFIVKKGVNKIDMYRGDNFAYVKFNTNQNIKFKKFYMTDSLKDLISNNIKTRELKSPLFSPLSYYYNLFSSSKIKSRVLKEIKNNLM